MNSTAFLNWWNDIGSGMAPLPGEDQEEHTHRIAGLAWRHCEAVSATVRVVGVPGYPVPAKDISTLSLELAARAWTMPETSSIEVDARLATAFARILTEVLSQPWLGNATNKQLLDELAARIPLGYRTVDGCAVQTDRMAPKTHVPPAEAIAQAVEIHEKHTLADSMGDR